MICIHCRQPVDDAFYRFHCEEHEQDAQRYHELKQSNIRKCHEAIGDFLGTAIPNDNQIQRAKIVNDYLRTMLQPKQDITINNTERSVSDWPGVI